MLDIFISTYIYIYIYIYIIYLFICWGAGLKGTDGLAPSCASAIALSQAATAGGVPTDSLVGVATTS